MRCMESRILTTLENFNLPHIYYTNPTQKVERNLYMQTQFKKYGLKNTRIDMPWHDGDGKVPYRISSRMIGNYSPDHSHWVNYVSALIFDFLSDWYNNTDEPYFILMEDDYDLSIIPKWGFSWDEFMDHIPYDWDCVQLGFECPNVIPFYLHPIKIEYSLGASLLKREFIEKLLDLHFPNGKFKFDYKLAHAEFIDRESGIHDGKTYNDTSGGPDHLFNHTGRCYSIPMIPINPYLSGMSHDGITADGVSLKKEWEPKISFVKCHEAYHDWWNNDRTNYSLEELFTYNKKNDKLMQRDISKWDDKYFHEKALRCREEFLSSWN